MRLSARNQIPPASPPLTMARPFPTSNWTQAAPAWWPRLRWRRSGTRTVRWLGGHRGDQGVRRHPGRRLTAGPGQPQAPGNRRPRATAGPGQPQAPGNRRPRATAGPGQPQAAHDRRPRTTGGGTQRFDVASGLLVPTIDNTGQGGAGVITTTEIQDYRELSGVQYPYVLVEHLLSPDGTTTVLTIRLTDVKCNVPVD